MSPLVHLVGPVGRGNARDGGVERYHRWLARAWAGRLGDDGVSYALKAAEADVVRTGNGCSAAWVRACGRSRLRWARYVARERKHLEDARRVVAISPMVAAELALHYGRVEAVTVLLNPVFDPPARPEPRAAGSVVFVGHAAHRKGLDRWLTVVERLGLAGHVIGNLRPRQTPGVTFHGAVPAGPWIAGARMLLHPARYEPYGNVVAEAVRAGTPAVVSTHTGAACLLDPSHVWDEDTGIEGLVRVVERALQHPRAPSREPPSGEAHLAALADILTVRDFGPHSSDTPGPPFLGVDG
jgi:glycosyltransferase involved in cell wall biosynthesis